jgi:hypothetical protein
MGLFDNLFKKKNQRPAEDTMQGDNQLREFERDLIQEVALTMFQMKITKQPGLNFFHNDHGIFEGIFISHTTDPQMLMIAQQDFNTYMMVLGCHTLGTAAYVATCQGKYKKPLEQFGETEMREIAKTIHDTDAYEVGLKALGFAPDGNNKKCLDRIVVVANTTAQKLAGGKIYDKRYQKVYMQVLYNAGVSLIYGR